MCLYSHPQQQHGVTRIVVNMVNKCVAHGCKTGYDSEKTSGNDQNGEDGEKNDDNGNIATFHFPNKECDG